MGRERQIFFPLRSLSFFFFCQFEGWPPLLDRRRKVDKGERSREREIETLFLFFRLCERVCLGILRD